MDVDRTRPLHVLVVDDSAVVRMVLSQILSGEPGITVAVASDPIIAAHKIKVTRPDVIVLDIEMPRMNGLTFLERLMAEDPIPVVVCSGVAGNSKDAALRAFELGAVDVLKKPQIGVRDFLEDTAVTLIDAIRGAAGARAPKRVRPELPRPARNMFVPFAPGPLHKPRGNTTEKLVAIGASTGGTEALRYILKAMPPDGPAFIIVQHMPEGFTKAFADRLNEECKIEVKEAADGDRVVDGRALIAPGDKHTKVMRTASGFTVAVRGGDLVSRHRPSVDVLFRSVATAAGPNAVGVIMTGMGDDGADGLHQMKRAGAVTLAQDEASCVVFGMPKEAIARGAVSEIVRLEHLPATIMQRMRR